jgi:hypothetical protein
MNDRVVGLLPGDHEGKNYTSELERSPAQCCVSIDSKCNISWGGF